MAGNLTGMTDFTGLRVGAGAASTASGGAYPAGTAQYAHVYSVVTVVATTCVATKSTTTTATLSGVTLGDFVDIAPGGSGLSAGVVAQAWVSAADQITIAYSNVSAANAAQIATPFRVQFIKVVA